MEPMTLGSAPASPASPPANSPYLPVFLTGETPPNISTGRTKTPSGFSTNSANINDSVPLRQRLFSPPRETQSVQPQSPAFGNTTERLGPPKLGLFDAKDAVPNKTATPVHSSTIAHSNDNSMFIESFSRIQPEESSFMTNRSINNTRLDNVDSQWVTVFGFSPNMLNVIMTQLANCGMILEKKIPSQGNWIHVKFNNLNEVARALSLNGKCINANTMIGVQLHHATENKENNTGMISTPIRARSLRHSVISPQVNNSVIQSPNVPQKSSGIVTKAMEYVFGW